LNPAIGHVREYLMFFLWAALLLGRLRRRRPIDILQVCQPPDVYFHCARPCAGWAPGSWSTSAT